MKKKTKIIVILFIFLSLALKLVFTSHAEDYVSKYSEYLEEDRHVSVTEFLTGESDEEASGYEGKIDEFYNLLPDELKGETFTADPKEAAEKYNSAYFLKLIIGKLKAALSSYLAPTALFVTLVIISFVIKSVSADGKSGAVSGVLRAAVCLGAASGGVLSFTAVSGFLKTLTSVSASAIPACIALLISSGRTAASGVSAAYIMSVCALTESVFCGAVLPMLSVSAALTFAEALFPEEIKPSLSSFIRKAATWIAVSVSAVSSFVFGVQSHLANAADTVGMKTVKFALGSSVPFVGGSLGDTVSAISAGAASVKSAFGVSLLIIILLLLLTPAAGLVMGKISLGVSSVLSGVLGLTRESSFFTELSGILSSMLALVLSAAAVFMVIIVTFISLGAVT